MSTLRNIAAHLWRGSRVRKANVILGVTGAALSAACAADNAVAPAATPNAQRVPAPAFDDASAKPAPVAKNVQDSIKQYNKAQMDSLKNDWQAYKRAVQSGSIEAEFVRCEPQPEKTAKKVIGPKGGTINIGPNRFEVPAGALDSNVTITATAPMSSRAELRFQPHGLQFNKPVEMTINYKGCIVPDGGVLGVTYVAHPMQSSSALTAKGDQRMPTHDDKNSSSVSALTDHFSGYALTWGRN